MRASTRGADAMGDGNAPGRAGVSGDGVNVAGGRAPIADTGAAADGAGAVVGRVATGGAVVTGAVDGGVPREATTVVAGAVWGGVPREATAVVAGAAVGRDAIAGVEVDGGD
jgi:hypothetical protein